MEHVSRQTGHTSLAPHQIEALRDAVNHHRASTDTPSNALIFLSKLFNPVEKENVAVTIYQLSEEVAVVDDTDTRWVRHARKG